jgi:hypothetical protein
MLVLSAGEASPAYHSVANGFIGPEALISLLTGVGDDATAPPRESDDAQDQVRQVIRRLVADADEPVRLAQMGTAARAAVGAEIDDTSWFGKGGLSAFIRSLPDEGLALDRYHVWDPDRHDAPQERPGITVEYGLPPLIDDIRDVTDLPPLVSSAWPPLFAALADYAYAERFNLSECTAMVRDRLQGTEHPVSRSVISVVVRGAKSGGIRLDDTPPPTADEIREGFLSSVIDRSEATGATLELDEKVELGHWLRGVSETLRGGASAEGAPAVPKPTSPLSTTWDAEERGVGPDTGTIEPPGTSTDLHHPT